ncbi:MAG: response regulator, partial [Spirochaetia bacterium]|jgi:CheY-like chemotaxis protein
LGSPPRDHGISGTTPRGTETLLVVEDEPSILKLTSMMLEGLGYTVLTALAPREALRQVGERTGAIDLLITDVVMPEMNGRELAGAIARMRPELKCLYVSGHTADIIARQGIIEEGVHFLSKPFTIATLGKKVREILG